MITMCQLQLLLSRPIKRKFIMPAYS